MTIAEYLEQKGRQEGRQEGRMEGEREAAMKIARTLLANGFDLAEVIKLTGLSADDLAPTHR